MLWVFCPVLMEKMFRKSLVIAVTLLLLFSFSFPAHAMDHESGVDGQKTGKDQFFEFQNKHYGPMLVTFIQEGELLDIQSASFVILDTGQKILHKFNAGDAQGDRTIQVRHFGGVWEVKVGSDVNALSSKDVIKEANCLKPNYWGKKE